MLVSAIARFVRHHRTTTAEDVTAFVRTLYPYIAAEYFLPWEPEELDDIIAHDIDVLDQLGLILTEGNQLSSTGPATAHYAGLYDLAEIVEPVLERFYIVQALIIGNRQHDEESLETEASAIARKLSVLYGINSPTFFDQSLFRGFIDSLRRSDTIRDGIDGIERGDGFDQLLSTTAETLDADIRYNVRQALDVL